MSYKPFGCKLAEVGGQLKQVGKRKVKKYTLYHNHNHLFSITVIHKSGYRTCQYITINTVQIESLQYNTCNINNNNNNNLRL